MPNTKYAKASHPFAKDNIIKKKTVIKNKTMLGSNRKITLLTFKKRKICNPKNIRPTEIEKISFI